LYLVVSRLSACGDYGSSKRSEGSRSILWLVAVELGVVDATAKDTACVYVSHESQCRFTGEPLYITTLENFTRANVRVCGTPQIELRSGIEESWWKL